jgi:hypothetical protein
MGRHKKPRHYPPAVHRYREKNPGITFTVPKEIKKGLEDLAKGQGIRLSKLVREHMTGLLNPEYHKAQLSEAVFCQVLMKGEKALEQREKDLEKGYEELEKELNNGAKAAYRKWYEDGRVKGMEEGTLEVERRLAEERREASYKISSERDAHIREGYNKAAAEFKQQLKKIEKEYTDKIALLEQKHIKREAELKQSFERKMQQKEEEFDDVYNETKQEFEKELKRTYAKAFEEGREEGLITQLRDERSRPKRFPIPIPGLRR